MNIENELCLRCNDKYKQALEEKNKKLCKEGVSCNAYEYCIFYKSFKADNDCLKQEIKIANDKIPKYRQALEEIKRMCEEEKCPCEYEEKGCHYECSTSAIAMFAEDIKEVIDGVLQ